MKTICSLCIVVIPLLTEALQSYLQFSTNYSPCIYNNVTKSLLCDQQSSWTRFPLIEKPSKEKIITNITIRQSPQLNQLVREDLMNVSQSLKELKLVELDLSTIDYSLFHIGNNQLVTVELSNAVSTSYRLIILDQFLLNLSPTISALTLRHFLVPDIPFPLFQTTQITELTLQDIYNISLWNSNVYSNFTTLRYLSLQDLILKDVSFIHEFRFLQKLRIVNCGLKMIPTLKSKSIELLDLSQNDIHTIDSQVFVALEPSLIYLDLSQNPLSDGKFPGIFQLTYLQELNLGDTAISIIPSELNSLTNLKRVVFSNTKIRALHFNALANLRQLEVLDVSWLNLLTLSTTGWNKTFSLRRLVLSGVAMKNVSIVGAGNDWRGVFSILSDTLQNLFLMNCQLDDAIWSSLQPLTNLVSLYLSYNRLTSIPHRYFLNFPNLREIYLNGNFLRSLDAIQIRGLQRPDLLRFDMSNNQIQNISTCLLHQMNLTALLFRNNFMSCDCKMRKVKEISQDSNWLSGIICINTNVSFDLTPINEFVCRNASSSEDCSIIDRSQSYRIDWMISVSKESPITINIRWNTSMNQPYMKEFTMLQIQEANGRNVTRYNYSLETGRSTLTGKLAGQNYTFCAVFYRDWDVLSDTNNCMLTVIPPQPSDPSFIIVAAVVGGILGFLLLVGSCIGLCVCLCWVKFKRDQSRDKKTQMRNHSVELKGQHNEGFQESVIQSYQDGNRESSVYDSYCYPTESCYTYDSDDTSCRVSTFSRQSTEFVPHPNIFTISESPNQSTSGRITPESLPTRAVTRISWGGVLRRLGMRQFGTPLKSSSLTSINVLSPSENCPTFRSMSTESHESLEPSAGGFSSIRSRKLPHRPASVYEKSDPSIYTTMTTPTAKTSIVSNCTSLTSLPPDEQDSNVIHSKQSLETHYVSPQTDENTMAIEDDYLDPIVTGPINDGDSVYLN